MMAFLCYHSSLSLPLKGVDVSENEFVLAVEAAGTPLGIQLFSPVNYIFPDVTWLCSGAKRPQESLNLYEFSLISWLSNQFYKASKENDPVLSHYH